ncbi:C1 family peptidase [Cyclobacterium sp. 1_MG-2023]|uniref:C1 family peptidase n=1 Tax=Cyclobacterium sp. 1_MG-2023 TaxID=3062681 RepID=UPI0026E27E0E|nr:C1 family peptidase [Cyclobacterium sp. 1_MG-2023]MDO6440045.1 C1 family peptidase [Cyclobacterium sp. 1_MG-2023]
MKKHTLLIIAILFNSYFLFAQNTTGLVFIDQEEYKDIPLATSAMMGTLPSKVDLSSWFPSPGNQGQQSSCVGWAVAYGLKSYQEARERNLKPTSNNQIYSPSFIYNQIKLGSCGGGSSIVEALNLLKSSGVSTIEDFPYSEFECSSKPNQTVKQKAKNYAIAEWRRVNFSDDIEVKSQLNSGFPIVIGMRVDQGFENLGMNQIYTNPSGQEKGGHAMVVTGYDDSKKAYKILNSWSTNFGTNGYAWVSYSAFKARVREAYSSQDIVINNPDAVSQIEEQQNINDNVTIPPPIPPSAVSVNAILNQPIVNHNQIIQTPIGNQLGMIISVPGNIFNGRGSRAQVVIRFYMQNGAPLFANVSEKNYRDVHGLVASGTMRGQVFNDPAPLGNHLIYIPYYALNFPATNGSVSHNVNVQATLYVNEFEKAKSNMTPMIIRW